MNQHGVQVLATLKREKRLANTVGLILIVLCFTFIPALITPLVLVVVGFKGNAVLPFRPFYRFLVTLNGLLNPLLNYGRNADVRRAVRGLIRCPQRVTQVHPGRIGDNGVNRNNRDSSNTQNRMNAETPLQKLTVLSCSEQSNRRTSTSHCNDIPLE